jgi:glycosyltransferase involved in cell wall biosynthesis
MTRWAAGGAREVVAALARHLDRRRFEPALAIGAIEPGAALPDVSCFHLPRLRREVSPADDLRSAVRLARAIHGWHPDVVHGHTYKAGVVASIVARLLGTPAVIFTPHGHIFGEDARIPGVPRGGWRRAVLYWIHRGAGACAHRVTTLSEADWAEHRQLRLASDTKLVVIENGVDVGRFNGRRGGSGLSIASVGRLSEEKGHRYLIEAMPRIRGAYPGAVLSIAGDGPERGALERRAQELGLDSSVRFLGQVNDTPDLLSGTDVYVQPSLYEGLGLSIAEAMAAGCAVVATRVGGVPALVRDGATGVLVRPADPAALAEAVVGLLSDAARARSLAEAARVHVARHFSLRRMVERYEALYEELAG